MPLNKVMKVSKHASKGTAKQVATPIKKKPAKATERNNFEQPKAKVSGTRGSCDPAAAAVAGVFKPTLHLFNPCSAQELGCGRRENWVVGGYSDANLCCEGVQHQPMGKAPIVARKIATSIASECDDLDTASVCGGDSSNMGGEIIVISNPGSDPKKACLQALAIEDKVSGMEEENMKSIHAQATLKEASQRKYQHEHTCVGHMVKFALEDEEHGLQRIFEFNFSENIVCAPVVYGGYAPDGSIVGVLSSRVWT